MKTPINLESAVFDMKAVISACSHRSFLTWKDGKENLISLPDFGTLFIGDATLTNSSWLAEEAPDALVFHVPSSWRMPQIVKALGAFDSTSQARKNGWDIDVPEGIGFHIIRINKVRGMLVTMR